MKRRLLFVLWAYFGVIPKLLVGCLPQNVLLSALISSVRTSVLRPVICQYQSVQLLSRVWLFLTAWTVAGQASPVHHQLPELTQTHVCQVGDAIQPSHPLLSPSPPAFDLSQHQGLFQWVSSLHQVAKHLGTILRFTPSRVISLSVLVSFTIKLRHWSKTGGRTFVLCTNTSSVIAIS